MTQELQVQRAGSEGDGDPRARRVCANTARVDFARRSRRRLTALGILAGVTVAAFIGALMVGPIPLSAGEVLTTLLSPGEESLNRAVVVDLRLPGALMAVLVGAALSLAGAQMQTILANPLAEPFTLGISAAAALGASVVIVTGFALPMAPGATVPLAAMIAGLAASLGIAAVARMRGVTQNTVILLGIALVFSCQALLALLQYRASTESLQQIVFWSMGSMTRSTWTSVIVVAVAVLIVTPLFWINGWKLTALSLGEPRAKAMGVDVSRLRAWTLVGVAVLASLAVAFVGIIGFVGLVGPHIARILLGEDQRFLIPGSILGGAAILTAAHTVSQIIVPGVAVPVGILTSLVGVPVFVAIITARQRLIGGGGL